MRHGTLESPGGGASDHNRSGNNENNTETWVNQSTLSYLLQKIMPLPAPLNLPVLVFLPIGYFVEVAAFRHEWRLTKKMADSHDNNGNTDSKSDQDNEVGEHTSKCGVKRSCCGQQMCRCFRDPEAFWHCANTLQLFLFTFVVANFMVVGMQMLALLAILMVVPVAFILTVLGIFFLTLLSTSVSWFDLWKKRKNPGTPRSGKMGHLITMSRFSEDDVSVNYCLQGIQLILQTALAPFVAVCIGTGVTSCLILTVLVVALPLPYVTLGLALWRTKHFCQASTDEQPCSDTPAVPEVPDHPENPTYPGLKRESSSFLALAQGKPVREGMTIGATSDKDEVFEPLSNNHFTEGTVRLSMQAALIDTKDLQVWFGGAAIKYP